jgi:hypothetical protein
MTTLTPIDLHPAASWDAYRDGHLNQLSDQELVGWAGRRLAVPREAPADSFVLHAPLELAARAALLAHVRPSARELARVRIVSLVAGYESSGPPVVDPVVRGDDDNRSTTDLADALVTAIRHGELADVDVAASRLGREADGYELRRLLTGLMIGQLGAAAHGSIFLWLLPRVAPRREITAELLRGLARELGRYPDWQLHWTEHAPPGASNGRRSGPDEVFEAVASTPRIRQPNETFIFPLMSYVDDEGIAARQLAPLTGVTPVDHIDAGRAVLRVAAWSMLDEDDTYAPYGWSHCLTLPQAVLGIAPAAPEPLTALRVAATYVVGFRSALATEPVVTEPPSDPHVDWREALDADRATAAAAVWHAPANDRRAVAAELAGRAASRHDAHLVKYTLACFDAAADDPTHAPLFLAAAASLGAWWHAHGDPDDPLA